MLPPDLMAALASAGGHGAAPPPGGSAGPGAGPNPLAALIAGHGGPPPGGPAAGPPPPGAGGGGSEDQPISLLKQMIDLGKRYVEVEPDEEDKATMTKVLSTLQGYLAKDQKENDQMLGGVMSP